MKKIMSLFVFSIMVLLLSTSVHATRYWPPLLTEWNIYLNNGVAYINSPQFASHCSYSRGHIPMDGTEFNKAQYAYAISAKAKGKKLKYVIDNTHTTCIVSGLQEVD